MATTAYVSLGSNLGDSSSQIDQAIEALGSLPKTELTGCAPRYQSVAVGPGRQADYINTVARLSTELEALGLLQALQRIETAQGRVRTERWAARTLDLDILLYDNLCMQTPELTLPHPRLCERNFVLIPLHDLAPGLVLPDGSALKQQLANCSSAGIVRV